MGVGGEVNLALTGLTLRKHVVKRAIPHRGKHSLLSTTAFNYSVLRYKHGNYCKSLDMLQLLLFLLGYIAVLRR